MTTDAQTTARERMAWMFDALQQAVIATDVSGLVIFWNRYAQQFYGWTSEEVMGRPIVEITPGLQSAARAAEIMSMLSRGNTWAGDHEVRHRDGSTFIAAVTLIPLFDEDGRPAGVFGLSEPRAKLGDAETRARASGELLAETRESLRTSQEGYRSLFENAIDAVFLCTPEREILEVNPAAIGLFGFSEAELKQKGTDLILPSTSPDYQLAERELDAHGRFRGKQVLHRKNGSTFIGEVSIGRFHDRTGAIRSTVIVRDISADIGAETKFRTLLEHAVLGVHMVRHGRFIYCNPGGQRILGYSEAELMAMDSIFDIVVDEDRERVVQVVSEWLAAPAHPLSYRSRVRRGDGTIIEIAVQGTVIEYDGSPVILGTCIDITEQQQAAEQLLKSENRYRTLVEEAQDIIFSCDINGKITSLNQAFEQITGWKREEWIGRSYEELLEPDSVGPAQEHFQSILDDQSLGHRQSRLRTASGPPILIEGTARALHLDGRVVGTLGIVRDISERRRMEVALERSARFTALGRLAATIAHEFNNVLMGVQATVDLMRRSTDEATIARGLESLRTGIGRGRRMTQEVLQFTRMPDPDTEPFRLIPLIESMRHELETLAGPRIRVRMTFKASSDATVAGDRAQIQQVLMNLVINARDAMPDGGRIMISVSEEPPARAGAQPMLAITVSDTGAGIAPEMIGLIFEPLFTTKKSGGTGLGLAIVTQIIERHHGTIDVESTPGQGTTFRIALPLSGRDERIPDNPAPSRPGMIERLLIVDDEPMITDGLSAVLELEGIATDVAALGRDAEGAVERFSPQIVLLDLNLPDMSGAEVYEILTRRWPTLPIIISSGHVDEALVREMTHGARATFLAKPYDMETLLQVLAAATTPR